MTQRLWFLAALLALTAGCGKQSTSPPAAQTSSSSVRHEVERHAQHVNQALEDEAKAIEEAIGGVKTNVKSAAQKHADDLSEFAAKMAEDAKDRASDVPDMVDMMFDPPTRRQTYRPRDDDNSRGSKSRR